MNVFISYRRSDSQDVAARLADRLSAEPGIGEVFIDVEDIEPGADFSHRIDEAIADSDVCLALIGGDWVGRDPAGGPARILHSDDFVRREVAAALASGRQLIPVLINEARMPVPGQLPDEIRPLTTRNAVFLRHASFNQDLALLVDTLFGGRRRSALMRWLRRNPVLGGVLRAAGGMLTAGVLLIGAAAVHSALTGGQALEVTLGDRGLVWLLILLSLGLGAALPLLLSRRR